jgi:hypothetical protein
MAKSLAPVTQIKHILGIMNVLLVSHNVPSSLAASANIVRHDGARKQQTPIKRSRSAFAPESGPGSEDSTSACSTDDGQLRTQANFAYQRTVSSWPPQLTSLSHPPRAKGRSMLLAFRHVIPSRLSIRVHRPRSRIRHRTGNTARQVRCSNY